MKHQAAKTKVKTEYLLNGRAKSGGGEGGRIYEKIVKCKFLLKYYKQLYSLDKMYKDYHNISDPKNEATLLEFDLK